jgi:hypothetical protein
MKKGFNRSKSPEKIREDQNVGIQDEDIYDRTSRQEMVDDDELETWEAGFMEGAEKGGQKAKCATCGKVLAKEKTVEKKFNSKLVWFCSNSCVKGYEKDR